MRRHDQSEVLVVGAGPVGMFTALRLAQSGISVKVIDQESRTAGRSYACALHPRSLQLLDEVGVAREAIQMGYRIDKVAFYEGAHRRAELDFSQLPVEFPFVLVLEQCVLEDLLEQKLKERAKLKIQWNHRLADLTMNSGVSATIEELVMTGKGYIVPDFDLEVKKTVSARADYVVGADGQNSLVRQRLEIPSDRTGRPQLFTVYELETETKLLAEMRIVFHEQTVSVLWPFAENKCRWSFQWFEAEKPADFPQKDRNRFTVAEFPGDNDSRHHLQQLLFARAPWFQAGIKHVGWAANIQFDHRVARRFGRERTWLAGDAAHQTGPMGMQSMNVGFREGADLAARLARILREAGSPDLLEAYQFEHRTEWERLLGLQGAFKAGAAASPWVRGHRAELPVCVPASSTEMTLLLRQLGLEFDQVGERETAAVV